MSSSNGEPSPELTTIRTGGRSARVIAAGFAAVLVGVIYVGISGHNGPAGPVPASAAAMAPTPKATERVLPHLDAIQAIRANPNAPVLYQYLGARLSFGGHATLAILDAVGENEYRVSYRIPYSLVASPANLNISTVIDTVSHDDFDVLGSWVFPLDAIAGSGAPAVVLLDAQQPPAVRTLANPTFTRVAGNGFRVAVVADSKPEFALLTVQVEVTPDPIQPTDTRPSPIFPNEDYAVVAKVGGQTFTTDPSTIEMLPGHMRGEILLPLHLNARRIAIELSAIPSADPLLGRLLVVAPAIGVPRVADHTLTKIITVTGGDPNPGFPQVMQTGYTLRLLSTFDGFARAVFWDLQINATSADADPVSTANRVAHNWVTGDDGLIGWPTALAPVGDVSR